MFKQLNTTSSKNALYLLGLALILGSTYLLRQIKAGSTLSKRSDAFYRLLSNDKQYADILLKKEDIYAEMTKLYLALKNDSEFSHLFSHYFHTYFHRGVCNFPTFLLAQALSVKLISEGAYVSDLELVFLTRARSPWSKAVRWIKLSNNNEDDGGRYTNFVCKKSQATINKLIEGGYRCNSGL